MASTQDFDSGSNETLSAQEARMVMEAFTRRHPQAPAHLDANSVQAMASGLGVTETEIRRMLEDVRVQQRSEQMAAGILQQQHKHRKQLDVTAAIGAAVAIIVVVIAVAGYLFFRPRSESIETPGPVSGPVTWTGPEPPQGLPAPNISADGGDLTVASADGSAIHLGEDDLAISKADGTAIHMGDDGVTISRADGTTIHVETDVPASELSDEAAQTQKDALESVRASIKQEIEKYEPSRDNEAFGNKAVRKALEKLLSKLDERIAKLSSIRG